MINEIAAGVKAAGKEVIKEKAKEGIGKMADKAIEKVHDKIKEIPDKIEPLSNHSPKIENIPNKIEPIPNSTKISDIPDKVEPMNRSLANPAREIENGKTGGSYKDIKIQGEGDRYEVHHMPADSASKLERNDGPAIKMEKADHRQTASCGMSREAREYRERQKDLIDRGNFSEALTMDIDDIHSKFGAKYDGAINEMLEYVEELNKEGKI